MPTEWSLSNTLAGWTTLESGGAIVDVMKTLEGKAALVTGGSRGLGNEVARALARQGARVVMVARDAAALAEAVRDVRADAARDVHGLAFDVGRKEDVHAITGAAAALVGPLDVLVHAASTLGPLPMPLLLDTACEDLGAVLEVNLVGPFRLTKVIAGSMALRRTGTVVFVSSDAAAEAYPRWGAYGISKAAQDHLARVFAAEVPHVRFLAVDPGEMDTKMHADAIPDADRSTLARPADVAERLVSWIASGAEKPPSGARVTIAELASEGGAR
jgi:NAD(P)-dependent dehydrogenase (short-subunit alcohol dehydrogenase family)